MGTLEWQADRCRSGGRQSATRFTATLVDLSRRHVLPHWVAFGARFQRALAVKADGLDSFPWPRYGGQQDGVDSNYNVRSLTGLIQVVEALRDVGRIAEGLALLNV
jgi:hypothetical protein